MAKHHSSGKGFLLGALFGGLLGSVSALLFAPKSGKKTRKKIVKGYRRVSEDAKDLIESACDTSIELAGRAQDLAKEAEAAAKSCKKRLR